MNEAVGLEEIESVIDTCLKTLYEKDELLFSLNDGRGICERALVFRFAHYLQNEIDKKIPGYIVDCDYNSSVYVDPDGNLGARRQGKPIQNGGRETKRFIDIIVHNRGADNLFCIEVKKWNNYRKEDRKKDENNLKELTRTYGYKYGFHLILGEKEEKTRITVYRAWGSDD